MTSIVGVLCSDGAVIGTDSVATFSAAQFATIEQQTEKLSVIGDVIVAGTGAVGLSQRFCAIVDNAYTQQKLFARQSPIEVVKALSRTCIEDMAHTYLNPGKLGALIAFPCNNSPQICEFQLQDFQPELKDRRLWYVSMGGAQPITDPFLGFIRRVFWESGQPSVNDAIFAVTWTLQHAIDLCWRG